jgi:DNA-binding XRE family transcriptional regulator
MEGLSGEAATFESRVVGLHSYEYLSTRERAKLEHINREFERQVDRLVAQRLRERRVALDMTQGMLADRVGVTIQQIHRYERGESRITAGRLSQFAGVLNVNIHYFFTLPGTARPNGRRRKSQ